MTHNEMNIIRKQIVNDIYTAITEKGYMVEDCINMPSLEVITIDALSFECKTEDFHIKYLEFVSERGFLIYDGDPEDEKEFNTRIDSEITVEGLIDILDTVKSMSTVEEFWLD